MERYGWLILLLACWFGAFYTGLDKELELRAPPLAEFTPGALISKALLVVIGIELVLVGIRAPFEPVRATLNWVPTNVLVFFLGLIIGVRTVVAGFSPHFGTHLGVRTLPFLAGAIVLLGIPSARALRWVLTLRLQDIRSAMAAMHHVLVSGQDRVRWYHFVFAILFPYIGIPWGVFDLLRGKRRSGKALVGISVAALVLILAIFLTLGRERTLRILLDS